MKRLANLTSILLCLCAFVAGVAAAANLPSDWQREQAFDVPTTGLVKISLPVETLDSARQALSDLRLYDDAGTEIPYVIERPAPTPNVAREAKSFHVSLNPDNTVIIIETALTQPLDGVSLETPADDFIKAVRVESSEDGRSWQMIAQGQPIFRQPDGAGHLHVSWPARVSTWLRLTIDDLRTPPIPFTGAHIYAAPSEPAPSEWIPVKISERDESPGETRLALDLGEANMDIAAIQIETTEPLFMRPVTLSVAQMAENSIREQIIGQGVIFRVDIQGQTPSGNLSVPLENEIHARELVMFIKNGDTAPLAISGVRVERRPVYLVFLARQPGTFHLLTGNSHCDPPHYDLDALQMNLKSVAITPIHLPPPSANPNFHAPEVLVGIDLAGAALDVSDWKFRKQVKVTGAGAQQVELDLDMLAHAQPGFADVRLLRGSNQVPCIIERTSISRWLALTVTATLNPKDPKVSRWTLYVPRARLPLERLTCIARTPPFERSMSLYEELTDGRGNPYRHMLGGGSWRQVPARTAKDFALMFDTPPLNNKLFLETDNGDNPPIELEKFQTVYSATRILFKAKPDDELFLYYGNPSVGPPRYDLSLVADQMLAAEKNVASLSAEEQLKKSSGHENPMPGQGGLFFWVTLAAVNLVLLLIIARLLPKSPPPSR